MILYIADEAHFKEVISRVPKVKRSLWIGTADIKENNPRNSGGGVLFPLSLAKKKGADDDESKCNQKHIQWPFKN